MGGPQGIGMGQPSRLQQHQLGPQQQQQALSGLMTSVASGSEASGGSISVGSLSGRDTTSEQAASAYQLWQALAQAEAGQPMPQVPPSLPCQAHLPLHDRFPILLLISDKTSCLPSWESVW